MRVYLSIFALLILLSSCSSGTNLNLFSIKEDKEFGKKVADQIENEGKYKFLDSVKYAEVYGYVHKIRDEILNSGNVKHKDDFEWRIRIIEDDSTLNAFCTPGGYIYVFTGILKFLDSEDQFAGVLGHEIAHADLRHSTRQMTEMFGIQLLLELVAGDSKSVKEILDTVISLMSTNSVIPISPDSKFVDSMKEINSYFDTFVPKTILNWQVIFENTLKFNINQGRIIKCINVLVN
jgi:hypothetical protein